VGFSTTAKGKRNIKYKGTKYEGSFKRWKQRLKSLCAVVGRVRLGGITVTQIHGGEKKGGGNLAKKKKKGVSGAGKKKPCDINIKL